MPAIIGKFDSRAAKFFTGASFVLATIGNQIAAGFVSQLLPTCSLSIEPVDFVVGWLTDRI